MIKKLFTLLTVILFILSVKAQDKSALVQRINDVKSQSEIYYWDQFTHTNTDTAKVNATKRLLIDVNLHRNTPLSVEEIMPHASYINIDRGNLKQCFVYIKKEKADAGIIGSPTPTPVPEPVIDSPVSTSKPVIVSNSPSRNFVPDALVQRIMDGKSFMNVYKLLRSLQAQGQILQYGKLKDVSDYSTLGLILFDMQSQEIITVLSPISSAGIRLNEVNGSEDSLDNYPKDMTAVIWYIKK